MTGQAVRILLETEFRRDYERRVSVGPGPQAADPEDSGYQDLFDVTYRGGL
jgi:hypothetical protein